MLLPYLRDFISSMPLKLDPPRRYTLMMAPPPPPPTTHVFPPSCSLSMEAKANI